MLWLWGRVLATTGFYVKDPFIIKDESSLLALACQPVASDLRDLEPFLLTYLHNESHSQVAHDIIKYVFVAGGKRIRPALFFLACNMVGYKGAYRQSIGAVSEYVHTASLLHDDVVDSSTLRRNKPTTNSIWGDQSAVLVGDLIYSTASRMMAQTGKLEIVESFARAISQMSEGELLQLESIFDFELSEDKYFQILKGKTGILIGTACRAAGILAEVSQKKRQALEDFGFYIGIAFQIIDDALDYASEEQTFGKKIFSDLLEGKVTLPLIAARGLASSDQINWMRKVFAKPVIDMESASRIAKIVRETGGIELALKKAREYTHIALSALTTNFSPSVERDQLETLAKMLLHRVS